MYTPPLFSIFASVIVIFGSPVIVISASLVPPMAIVFLSTIVIGRVLFFLPAMAITLRLGWVFFFSNLINERSHNNNSATGMAMKISQFMLSCGKPNRGAE
ncbi:hypothetical protein ES703_77002 [subsurface metagenome]